MFYKIEVRKAGAQEPPDNALTSSLTIDSYDLPQFSRNPLESVDLLQAL
jgi:hypothetical protein